MIQPSPSLSLQLLCKMATVKIYVLNGNVDDLVDIFFFISNHKNEFKKETKQLKLIDIDKIGGCAQWIEYNRFIMHLCLLFHGIDEDVLHF